MKHIKPGIKYGMIEPSEWMKLRAIKWGFIYRQRLISTSSCPKGTWILEKR